MEVESLPELEEAMRSALGGSREARERFLTLLLGATVHVPERFQAEPISNAYTEYPDPFLNFLAFPADARVFVPVFSQGHYVEVWADRPLSHRSIAFTELIERLPPEWWLVLNPGFEVEKELSPWECDLLRGGPAQISTILRELGTDEDVVAMLEVVALPEEELVPVRDAVVAFAKAHGDVHSARLALERTVDADGEPREEVVVFVRTLGSESESSAVKSELQRELAPLVIGDHSVRVVAVPGSAASLLTIPFEAIPPTYVRSESPVPPFERMTRAVKKILKF